MDLLLAIRNDRTIAEVRLERQTKVELSKKYSALRASFLGPDTEVHDYAPAFRPDEDGILRLKFDLPQVLLDCRQSLPNGVPSVDNGALTDGIRALIAVDVGTKPSFLFQAIGDRYMLKPNRVAFLYERGFRFNETTGIVFADRLDAVHEDGYLYFKSEVMVRRFLDIEEYFAEATDTELQTLFSGVAFTETDIDAVKAIANTPLRRKLHGIVQSGRVVDSKSIQTVAKEIGFAVRVIKGKIVVPTNLKDFRDFVRIMDDAYLESMLDRRRVYLTTSKRPIKRVAG